MVDRREKRSSLNNDAIDGQSLPIDSRQDGSAENYDVDSERSSHRILELTEQRSEIFSQVKAQLAIEPSLDHPTISIALAEFFDFFAGYTNYFWNLPTEELAGHGRTYESVLNQVLDNTRRMWEQLNLAVNQRYNPVYQDKLAAADKEAAIILKSAKKIVRGMPILYFDKIFQVSRHPYQTYPLLGISQDRFEFDGNASLAHELGHHVFWNNGELDEYFKRMDIIAEKVAQLILGNDLPVIDFANPSLFERSIRSQFEQYNTWNGWVEEIFADVFGTLIIGPGFAKSAQDVQVRERLGSPEDLLENDGEHPMPALRPLISLSVLKHIASVADDAFGRALDQLCQQLEDRWMPLFRGALEEEKRVQEIGRSTNDTGAQHSGRLFTIEENRAQINPLVKLLLTTPLVFHADPANDAATSLLEAIDHWGKERNTSDLMTIQTMSEALNNDMLVEISNRIAISDQIAEKIRNQVIDPLLQESRLFDQFLDFVRNRVQVGAGNNGASLQDWQLILRFDLSLHRGHFHKNWDTHSHSIYHTHDAYHNVIT